MRNKKQLVSTKKLREIRQERGLTQIEMADMISIMIGRNVSVSLYQKWEQGVVSVGLLDAINVARELGVRVKDLWRQK